MSSLGVRSTSGTDCWCGGRGSRTTGGLVTLGTLASVLAAVPLASASPVFPRDAAAAAAAAFPPTLPLHPDPSSPRATATPSSQLSPSTPFAPTPTPPRPSSTQNPFLAPSPPQLGKRAVARLEEIGGWWLDSTAWSLNGRSGGFATATSSPLVDAKDSQDKKLGVIATTTRDAYKTATILADNTAAETSSSISLPRGWEPRSRSTTFYAIPVIIAMSVIVSIIMVGAIVGTVIWRRKVRKGNAGGRAGDAEKGKRKRKRAAATKEGAIDGMVKKFAGKMGKGKKKGRNGSDAGGSGGGSVAGRAAEVEDRSVGRLRQRRVRRQSSANSAERIDDEAAPLTQTGSSPADAPNNTLTSRLALRLRTSVTRAPLSPAPNPSVVFSRDVRRTRTHSTASSTAPSRASSLALSRTSSLASINSRRTLPEIEEPSTLGQPADPPSRSSISLASPAPSSATEFGLLFPSTIPVLGPPAYRPNSSTIQSTSRLTQSILPTPVVVVVTPSEDVPASDDENATHWPNEKPQRRPPPSTPPSSSPPLPLPDEPPVDRSTFSAHLATDDKTILARLGAAAASTSDASVMASASAPPLDEADEDGFEIFVPDFEEPVTVVGGWPEPPRAVETRFEYASPEGEVPGYRPRGEVMATASAPLAEWEESEEDVGEGERRRHAVV